MLIIWVFQDICPRRLSKAFVQDVCPRRLSKMSQQNLKQDSFQRHPGWLKVLKKHLEETSWTNVFDTGFGFHKHGFWDTSKNAMIFGKMEAFSFFRSHFFNIFSLMLAKNSIWNDFPRSIEALASIRKKFGLNSLPNNQRILTQVCRNFHSPDLDFWLYSLPSWQEVAW